jgi:hypothetical protein
MYSTYYVLKHAQNLCIALFTKVRYEYVLYLAILVLIVGIHLAFHGLVRSDN